MGEQADMMINGEVCEQCGQFLDEETGFPSLCRTCARQERGSRREARRQMALHDFDRAKQKADEKGLKLVRHTDQHYSLTNGKWLQNIHPGNQRLYWDRNKAKPPFLRLPTPWTLLDVVEAS